MRRALATTQCSKPSGRCVAQQPPGVNEERSPRPRRPARCCCCARCRPHRAARPQAYHRVHAELGHALLALGPRGVHALQRAPQRRRVHVAPRRCPTRCGPSGRRPGPASRPAKPSGTSRAPRAATDSGRTASRRSSPPKVQVHAVHGLNAVRRAQDGQGEGGVGQSVRLQHTRGGSLGLQAYSMTPGATRLSRLTGCTLSLASSRFFLSHARLGALSHRSRERLYNHRK